MSKLVDRMGMSLVEMLLVGSVIGLVATTITVVALDHSSDSDVRETRMRLERIDSGIQSYLASHARSRLPRSLEALTSPPGDELPYLERADLQDAWGREISYIRVDSRKYQLRSPGADGNDGTDDDVVLPRS